MDTSKIIQELSQKTDSPKEGIGFNKYQNLKNLPFATLTDLEKSQMSEFESKHLPSLEQREASKIYVRNMLSKKEEQSFKTTALLLGNVFKTNFVLVHGKEFEKNESSVDMTKILIDDKENDNFLRNTFVSDGAKYIKDWLLQVRDYVSKDDFLVVHGDCVSDINISRLISFHQKNNKLMTLTVAKPTGRNTILPLDKAGYYMENAQAMLPENQAWADACCRLFKADIFSYLEMDYDIEETLFRRLSDENQMISFFHDGFWRPMETHRDKAYLENLWKDNKAPWRLWK